MKTKIIPISLIIIFFIIFFIFYKSLQKSNIYMPKNYSEKNIPSFKATIFDTDNEINSVDFFENEKYYLVNIWASWCVPCRDEHSFLMGLKNQKNLNIIGLNYKDVDENAKKFLQELGNPYDINLLDNNGLVAIEWGAYGVPETFVIYDKKIIKRIIGPLNETLSLEIKKLIR